MTEEELVRQFDELGADSPPSPAPLSGYSRVKAMRALAKQRRLNGQKDARFPVPTWRDVERICLPSWFIARGIRRLHSLVVCIGPDLHMMLEPQFERLDDIECRTIAQNVRHGVLHWLLEAPNSVLTTTPEETEGAAYAGAIAHPSTVSETGSSASERMADE